MCEINQIKGSESSVSWVLKDQIPFVDTILNSSEKEMFNEIKNKKRKHEFYGVRWLLNELYPNTKLSYSKTGKPLLSNGKEISISHSGEVISIATTSNQLCGIDVQELTEKTMRLRSKFLNSYETKLINDKDIVLNNLAWSAKETLFKMIDVENMPFKETFHITEFEENKIRASVTHPKFSGEFELNYTIFDTFVMVYYI